MRQNWVQNTILKCLPNPMTAWVFENNFSHDFKLSHRLQPSLCLSHCSPESMHTQVCFKLPLQSDNIAIKHHWREGVTHFHLCHTSSCATACCSFPQAAPNALTLQALLLETLPIVRAPDCHSSKSFCSLTVLLPRKARLHVLPLQLFFLLDQ